MTASIMSVMIGAGNMVQAGENLTATPAERAHNMAEARVDGVEEIARRIMDVSGGTTGQENEMKEVIIMPAVRTVGRPGSRTIALKGNKAGGAMGMKRIVAGVTKQTGTHVPALIIPPTVGE